MRWTIDVDKALHRSNFWQATYLLQQMRDELLVIFSIAHGGGRPYHAFDAHATREMSARVGKTLHYFDWTELRIASGQMLDLLENDLPALSGGLCELTPDQRFVIENLSKR